MKNAVRPIRTLLLVASVASLVVACSSDDDDDDMAGGTDGEMNGGMVDGEMTLGTSTLSEVIAQPANGQPIDDGLDQVEADLLNQFGSPNSTPFPVAEDDTVESLLAQ